MKKNHSLKSVPLLLISIALGLPSLTIHAAESMTEMTESDLDNISAEAGFSLLNIFGAPAAGLTDDAPFDEQEGDKETTSDFQISSGNRLDEEENNTRKTAEDKLGDIESDQLEAEVHINTPILSFNEVLGSLKASEETIIKASALVGRDQDDTTTNELQYQNQDYHHGLEVLGKNEVINTRDLQIDLLKLENLRGDHFDDSRSVGSIYISDWHSQGSTHTQLRTDP